MKSFADFLMSNSIEEATPLPLVHTTRSFNLSRIMKDSQISTQECDVFRGEQLNYFFVGRPSYKYEIEDSSNHWMLPTAFVVNFNVVKPKRVFPFDSGGFRRRKMPKYIAEMEMDFFEASSVESAPSKIIGAFFRDPSSYMAFKGRPEAEFSAQFLLSPLDAEIHALRELSTDVKQPTFDDRQFTVEVQSDKVLALDSESVLAIVAPIVYMDDANFVKYFESRNIEVLTYDVYPLEAKMHFYAIYDRIKTFYKEKGLI